MEMNVYSQWVRNAVGAVRKCIGLANLNKLQTAKFQSETVVTKCYVVAVDIIKETVTFIDLKTGLRGESKCCEEDEFDINVGLAMAYNRAIGEWFPGEKIPAIDICKGALIDLDNETTIRVESITRRGVWMNVAGITAKGKELEENFLITDFVRSW